MTAASPRDLSRGKFPPRFRLAFTIIELLVAMVILTIILTVIFGITQQTGDAWRGASSKIEAFQGARAAFDTITRNLSQATLNTYYDYDNVAAPTRYLRKSDLHFISGKTLVPGQVSHAVFFQTPAGYSDGADYANMDTLLNACGYFIRYEKNPSQPPFLAGLPNAPADRYRYRLMQLMQPSQQLSIYAQSTGNAWFTPGPTAVGSSAIQTIADNIIALILIPKRSEQDSTTPLAPQYDYDSRSGGSNVPQAVTQNQLPPLVDVIMVAIDEPSAKRLGDSATPPDLGVESLFQSDPGTLETQLRQLEGNLNRKRIAYRIFRTTVPLRNSKWSS